MKLYRSLTWLLNAGFTLSSCSGSIGPKLVSVAGKPSAAMPSIIGADGEEKLAFAALDSSAKDLKSFLTADMKWVISDTSLSLSRPDGTSIVYDRASSTWSAVETFADAASYKSLYAFHDGSFTGLKPGILSFRKGSGKILSYDTSKLLTDTPSILGLNPGFFAAALSDGVMVVQGDGSKASAIKVKDLPATMLEIGGCVSGCTLWAYDGQMLYTFGNDSNWKKLDLPFDAPENKKVARYTMAVSLDAAGDIKVSGVAALTDDGLLYVTSTSSSSTQSVTFEQVKKVTTGYCVSCHSGDAFDQETGLKGRKSEILKRLALDASSAQVMPPKTAPKALSVGDKKILVTWLSAQTVGVDSAPVVSTPSTPVVDNATVAVTGGLQTQGQAYCVSCHPTAKFKAFWIDSKDDIVSRVNSGIMPKGKTMSAADKAELLKALGEIK
ncbi:MAG: hypothetical protein H7318_16460 [Oligoflexus sp.]|nr:hypothetical protein [Oligoflexus sp.]